MQKFKKFIIIVKIVHLKSNYKILNNLKNYDIIKFVKLNKLNFNYFLLNDIKKSTKHLVIGPGI